MRIRKSNDILKERMGVYRTPNQSQQKVGVDVVPLFLGKIQFEKLKSIHVLCVEK